MNELRSIFDLAFMSADLYHGGGPHLLIATSVHCPWCRKFSPYWAEIAEQLGSSYEVSVVTVEETGGEQIFREGMHFFFQHDVGESIGFPSMYVLERSSGVEEISPDVFWHPGQKQFLKQNLVARLNERIRE